MNPRNKLTNLVGTHTSRYCIKTSQSLRVYEQCFFFSIKYFVLRKFIRIFHSIPANGARVKNHQPVDLRESTSGGVPSKHHAGAVWLGSSHHEPASYPTLQISGRRNSYCILCFSIWNVRLSVCIYCTYAHFHMIVFEFSYNNGDL